MVTIDEQPWAYAVLSEDDRMIFVDLESAIAYSDEIGEYEEVEDRPKIHKLYPIGEPESYDIMYG